MRLDSVTSTAAAEGFDSDSRAATSNSYTV